MDFKQNLKEEIMLHQLLIDRCVLIIDYIEDSEKSEDTIQKFKFNINVLTNENIELKNKLSECNSNLMGVKKTLLDYQERVILAP
jgi:hypothetical protein